MPRQQHNAQDEGGGGNESRADVEKAVGFHQRAAGGLEAFHRRAREALQELAEQRIERTHQRVLSGGIADAGEARHVGDEGDAREGVAEIVRRHGEGEEADARPVEGQPPRFDVSLADRVLDGRDVTSCSEEGRGN